MNKPILFLDFDGPLFPERQIRHSPSMALYPGKQKFHPFIDYWEMDETSVRQLNKLYEIYQFDTVVSSSWRHYCDLVHVVELFEVNGLNLHIHENWATPRKMSSVRLNEICWWLDEVTEQADVNVFVAPDHIILDDPWSGNSLEGGVCRLHGLREPCMVNPDVGIDSDIYQTMLSTVTSWRDDPDSRVFTRNFPHRKSWDGIVPIKERD